MREIPNQTAIKFFGDRMHSLKGIRESYVMIDKVIDCYHIDYERDGLHLVYLEMESEKLVKMKYLSDVSIQVILTKEGIDFIKMMQDFKRV